MKNILRWILSAVILFGVVSMNGATQEKVTKKSSSKQCCKIPVNTDTKDTKTTVPTKASCKVTLTDDSKSKEVKKKKKENK
jgi:hypothetical protein|tara:strand:+ start:195 stop:437 length:243 start_codon:yes stop_codon:yes gene_type:complete